MDENAKSATTKLVLNERSNSLVRDRHIVEELEKLTKRARYLRDVPLAERRKQASKPLYLLRYE